MNNNLNILCDRLNELTCSCLAYEFPVGICEDKNAGLNRTLAIVLISVGQGEYKIRGELCVCNLQ